MSLSNYSENRYIDLILGSTDIVNPSNIYIGLLTNSSESSPTELSSSGYSRNEITFSISSTGKRQNHVDVYFTNNNSTTWSSVSHWGVWDASTGGNLLFYGSLGNTYTLQQYESIFIKQGLIEITANGTGFNLNPSWWNDMFQVIGVDSPGQTITAPTTHYAALHTTIDDEVTHPEYSRQAITFSGTGSSRTNSNKLVFDGTPPYVWGTIDLVAIYENSTGGSPLFMIGTNEKSISSNDKIIIEPNQLTFTVG